MLLVLYDPSWRSIRSAPYRALAQAAIRCSPATPAVLVHRPVQARGGRKAAGDFST